MLRFVLAGLALAALAAPAGADKFSMIPGVECDRDAAICTDERGPSVGLTRLYLGDEAADRLLATLEAMDAAGSGGRPLPVPVAPPASADPPIRFPKRGVACDDLVQACYTAKGHHNGMTKAQYGAGAVKPLARRAGLPPGNPEAIVRPGGGEVCDRLAGVCYRDAVPNLELTAHQLGDAAAARLSGRLPD